MATYGNGLNGSRDVYRTADLDSNLFLRAGQAIVAPFIEVVSPDQTQSTIISETNTGALYIDNSASDGSVFVKPGADHNLVVDGLIDAASAIGLTIMRNDLPGKSIDFEIDQNGSAIINSDGSIDLFPENTSAVNITSDVGLTVQPSSTFSPATITIQNIIPGNTSGFAIQVAPLGGALSLTGEVNGVASSLPSMTAAADGSYVSFQSDVVKVVGDLTSSGSATSGLVIEAISATGNAGLLIQNNNATAQGFQMVVGGQTAGGISEDHLQCYAYTGGANPKEIFDFTPDGSSVTFGEGDIVTGCFVGVNGFGGVGRVYDTAYNKPLTITSLQASTSGNIAYDVTSSFVAGVYQLQLSIEGNTPAVGTELQMSVSLPPSTSVVDFSGNSLVAAATSTASVCLNSSYFTVPAGNVRVLIASTGAAWTGTWSLQLVKVG